MPIEYEMLERGTYDNSGPTPMPLELVGKTLLCLWVVYRKAEGQTFVPREEVLNLINLCMGDDMPQQFRRSCDEGYAQERMTSGIVSGYLARRDVGSKCLYVTIDSIQAAHLVRMHELMYPDEVSWIRSCVVPHLRQEH